jgi:hypothetical protein
MKARTYSEDDKICHDCVGEDYLSKEIEKIGKRGKCAFCEQVTRTYTLVQMTGRVEQTLLDHYECTPSEPSDWEYHKQHVDKESTYVWYREGQTVMEILTNEFDIHEDAAAEIGEMLESRHSDMDAWAMGDETEFDSGVQYEQKGVSDEHWASEWERFGQILKSESRFFSQQATDILHSIFHDLDQVKTWSGKPVLTKIGPGKEIGSLFRARVFQSRDKLLEAISSPDVLLGSPETGFAMSGRMNAHGISVFYGATEAPVALAEVRPPVGSKVAVARFEIIRPLKALDLRELGNVSDWVSVFDPDYLKKMGKAVFLRHLAERMTAPVMPDDELVDYLQTQAIADYLASQTDITYDGIIYPSVQVADNKINVVLFHKAARVMDILLPPGTELEVTDEAYEEEGPYTSYDVTERIPARIKKTIPVDDEGVADSRELSLKVDLESIDVHQITAVQYDFESHRVHRSRYKEKKWKKADFDF